MAGESARDLARRRREKADRLHRVADAYERGADGEQATAAALAMLPPSEWTVFHDVRWPGRRLANIDHVAVGPAGVFVIDSKAWSGTVAVRDGVLRQNGYQRENAVAAAADAAIAVAEAIPALDPTSVTGVLCFVGQPQMQGWARDVLLCSEDSLVATLRDQPPRLEAPALRRVRAQVHWSLHAATPAGAWDKPTAAPATGGRTPTRRDRRLAASIARPVVRRREGSLLLRRVVGLVGGLLVIGLVTGLSFTVLHGFSTRLQLGLPPKQQPIPLGTAQSVEAATGRPPLRITPTRFVTTRARGGAPVLFKGNRWVAVRLVVHNSGKRTWVSQPGTSVVLTDSLGVPHRGAGPVRIAAGRLLPEVIRLKPGRTVRGYIVFQVPRTSPVTSVAATLGPGAPQTVTWVIDRQ